MITDSYGATYSKTSFQSNAFAEQGTIAPGVDYFVARNLSIGAELEFGASSERGFFFDASTSQVTETTQTTSYGGGLRVGYNIELGRFVSVMPRLTASYHSTWTALTYDATDGLIPSRRFTRSGPSLELFAPLLLHPRPHFFVGLGPDVRRDFSTVTGGSADGVSGTGPSTRIGASIVLGGTFGGDVSPTDRAIDDISPKRVPIRFGEKGVLSLGADFAAGGAYVAYDHDPSFSGSISVAPAADLFVVDDFAVGISLFAGSARSHFDDPVAARPITSASTSFGAGARVSWNIEIVRWLSALARGGMSAAHTESSSSEPEPSYILLKQDALALDAALLLLIHPAQHFFIGVGPEVSSDVTHDVHPGDSQNKAQTVRVTLSVGGWLKIFGDAR
jgi:hypothetical protein